MNKNNRVGALLWVSVALSAGAGLIGCGDDDKLPTSVPAQILPESTYAQRCVNVRTGTDPVSGNPYTDQKGNLLEEQLWLRSWTNDLYLWYNEVPTDKSPLDFDTSLDYFDYLKTPKTTASGAPEDKFHFTYDTTTWENLSVGGTEASYGINWALVAAVPPRKLLVAYVDPGSPGDTAGFKRGTQVLTIDGVDVENGSDVDTLNNGISPTDVNQTHNFVVVDPGASTSHTISVASANVDVNPVPAQDVKLLDLGTADKVGYMLFTDHVATAEQALISAITTLKQAAATDLVLDIRYNGGGYLDIAAELAYMIAGPSSVGETFEKETFNDKHPTVDPVTGAALQPTVFQNTAAGFSVAQGTQLPTLGLTRVFVLTTGATCSASEAVMNGLAGVGVQVIQIGDTTCGKPYGFYPQDNCGTTYFAIQFKGENATGFGDYSDGFVAGGQGTFIGCKVDDDFTHQLSDPAEALTAAAVYYRTNNACPPAATAPAIARTNRSAASRAGALAEPKSAFRTNRILGHQ
jgi:carboxyl-terminal processing protease